MSSSREVPTVEATDLRRSHRDGHLRLDAVNEVSLTVEAGEVLAVMGPSGSGKTTLLHLLGGLDRPDGGSVRVMGVDWETLRGENRARFRRETCGFVLQGLSLLPQATAAENVEVPLLIGGVQPRLRQDLVADALARMDMSEHAHKLPDQLSGGQQQRVAIARALVSGPALVLADEPTASLNSATATVVVQLLLDASRERGASVVLVSHDPTMAALADRVLRLRSGRLDSGEAIHVREDTR